MNPIFKALRWVGGELWEKLNIIESAKHLRELWRKYGWRFGLFAIIWELIEDVFFPWLCFKYGVPALAVFFWVFHFEPIVYPMWFWVLRTYDRIRGREPWEPEREAYSSHWRSICKVLFYKVAVTGWLVMIPLLMGFSPRVMWFYVPMMIAFGFVHERIWHDSNFGILSDDSVETKRIIYKSVTYGLVSTFVLGSLFKAKFMMVPWHVLAVCQTTAISMYLALEAVWSKNPWGIARVSRP